MSLPDRTLPVRAPLIGRERELRLLEEALQRAVTRRAFVAVTVLASRGLGKTRILEEFGARVVESARVLSAAPRTAGGRFDPIAGLLRQRASVIDGMSSDEVVKAMDGLHRSVLGADASELAGVLTAVASGTSGGMLSRAVEDEPAERAALLRSAFRLFVQRDAVAAPLVLCVDDLDHATDDALAVLSGLARVGVPVLLVVTARPEFVAQHVDWLAGVGIDSTIVEVAPLRAEEAGRVVLRMLEPLGDPPNALVESAVEVAGGNPALLGQMVRAFVASGTLARGEGGWEVHLERLDDAQLPLSVSDAVEARIGALSAPQRMLLEHASVMGGVFWLGGLVALGRMQRPPPELWGGAEDLAGHYRDLLAGLRDQDFVLALPDSSMPGDAEFVFKHNLEREALYGRLAPAELVELHLHVAEWLDSHVVSSEVAGEEHAELLAHHFQAGGASHKAALYWATAGDRARQRYANARAVALYEKALPLLGRENLVRQMDVLHNLGDVLQLLGRNEQAIEVFQRMRALAFGVDAKAKGGVAHNRIGRVYRAIGHLDVAMRHLGTAQALFEAAGDDRGIAASLDDIGKVHWMRGAYEPAERFVMRGLEMRRELNDARSVAVSLNNLGLVYQDSGRFEAARDAFDEALTLRTSIGDRAGVAQTLNNLATILQDQGDHEGAERQFTTALEHARFVGDRMRQAVLLTNLGETQYRLQQPERAIATLREAEELGTTLGDRILEGEILRGLAKAHMLLGELAEARALIGRSIALFEQARGRAFAAVAMRTLGEIEEASGWGGDSYTRARESFEASIAVFEELRNDAELARSALALASLLERWDSATHSDSIEALRTRAREIQARMTAAPEESTDPG